MADVLQELITNHVMTNLVLVIGGIGIVMRLLLGITYSKMVKNTVEIGKRKKEFTETLKKIYAACYHLEVNVNNVDKFVDKYINKQKCCGIGLYTFENICGQLCVFSGGISVISIVLAMYENCGQEQILEQICVCIFAFTMLITFSMLANGDRKKEMIQLYLSEYLENVYQNHLEKEQDNPALFEQYQKEMEQIYAKPVKKKKKGKKDSRRDEIEKMKQELVEELKQERIENEKKRLIAKQKEQEAEQEAEQEKVPQKAIQKMPQKETTAYSVETKHPEKKRRNMGEEKKGETTNSEQVLQDILREYLG